MQVLDIAQASTAHPIPISQDLAACPPAVYPGQHLAERYVVGERIGGGGMADVFRGHDLWLRRDVAIKVLKHGIASAEMCARMVQEGRAAAAIDHAHLLRVLDIGRIHPSAYLITDLLRGHSLAEYLRMLPESRLGWRRAIELLLPALDALQKVHDLGYIHRDLKPDNLFVHQRDGQEVLIVLDMGIAKVAPALRGEGAPVPTETGRLLGTPAYMSPEQASSLPLDHRTDIYSIAVTLHRMLAGRLPFEARPGDTPYMLMTRHIYDVPPRLSEAHPEIPEALADVVLRALAKVPTVRPQSMRELAGALRACLSSVDRPLETAARALERSAGYHRVSRMSGGVVLLVALAVMQGPSAGATTPKAQAIRLADPRLDRPTIYPGIPAPGAKPPSAAPPPALVDSEPALADSPQMPAARSPAALARVLDAAAGPIAQCIRGHGDIDLVELVVTLKLDPGGTVARAELRDRDQSTLAGCALPLLRRLRFPAGPAQRLEHTFTSTWQPR